MATKSPAPLTSLQCRAARAALRLQVRQLSELSGVGTTTIVRFEREKSKPIRANLMALRQAFEAAGVQFLNGDGLRVRPVRNGTEGRRAGES